MSHLVFHNFFNFSYFIFLVMSNNFLVSKIHNRFFKRFLEIGYDFCYDIPLIRTESRHRTDQSVENSDKGQKTDVYERSADETVRGLSAPVSAIFFILNNLITIESHVANVPQKVRVAIVQKMEFFQFLYRLQMQNAQSRQPESYTQDFSYSTDEIKFSKVVGQQL